METWKAEVRQFNIWNSNICQTLSNGSTLICLPPVIRPVSWNQQPALQLYYSMLSRSLWRTGPAGKAATTDTQRSASGSQVYRSWMLSPPGQTPQMGQTEEAYRPETGKSARSTGGRGRAETTASSESWLPAQRPRVWLLVSVPAAAFTPSWCHPVRWPRGANRDTPQVAARGAASSSRTETRSRRSFLCALREQKLSATWSDGD